LLVDTKGSVRGVYDSADRAALERLIADTNQLVGNDGKAAAANPEESNGAALFMSLGCSACHNNDRVAPPLGGLLDKSRRFVGGSQGVADAAYLKESIVAPGSKVVLGYLNLMPAYAQDLSETQIDSLVDYIQKLPAPPHAEANGAARTASDPSAEATLSVDPVCKMDVRIAASTPRFDHEGHSYYFCSEMCRDRFAKNPSQYLAVTH
jgi:YHS domain-containing protein/mono/diheme cytochrome c family protein